MGWGEKIEREDWQRRCGGERECLREDEEVGGERDFQRREKREGSKGRKEGMSLPRSFVAGPYLLIDNCK